MNSEEREQWLLKAERLKSIMVSRATGEKPPSLEYEALRAELLHHTELRELVPRCERWDERRQFLKDVFDPLLRRLQASGEAATPESKTRLDDNAGATKNVPIENSPEQQRIVPTSENRTPGPIVVCVHGIRTGGRWMRRIAPILKNELDCEVASAGYGVFGLFGFLIPGFRRPAIATVRWKLEHAIDKNSQRPLIIIAHSFGTYCITEILKENPKIKPTRMLFCGGIVPQNFRWDTLRQMGEVQGTFVVNECGARDIWPPLAHSMTFGFGASGTGGF